MNILDCKDFMVVYKEDTEIDRPTEKAAFTIQRLSFKNTDGINAITEAGYVFHDRVLTLEIDLSTTYNLRNSKLKGKSMVLIKNRSSIDSVMLEMAYQAYDTDRRFHLSKDFNTLISKKVIDAYVKKVSENDLLVPTAIYNEEPVGYTTIPVFNGEKAENVFGLTKPGIVGKISAYPLYVHMLDELQERGYKKYIGKVSTTNAASLNLHFELGAKVIDVVDEYIYRM